MLPQPLHMHACAACCYWLVAQLSVGIAAVRSSILHALSRCAVLCHADHLLPCLLRLVSCTAAAAVDAAGESQAEWFAEGLLERLVDKTDAVARHLLRDAIVYVMPNVCPDGTWRGHLRTNAAGRNLNREWASPSEEDSPEVYHLLKMMDREGEKIVAVYSAVPMLLLD